MFSQLSLNFKSSHHAWGRRVTQYSLQGSRRLTARWDSVGSFANPSGGSSFRTLGSHGSEHAQCSPRHSEKCCPGARAPGFACDPRRGQDSATPRTPGSVGIPRTRGSGGACSGALPRGKGSVKVSRRVKFRGYDGEEGAVGAQEDRCGRRRKI